jgi:3-hydroxyisobutyrate dehydrogenase
VLTLLPTADVVLDVMIDGGVVDALDAGAVWAQMGTIGVEGARRLGDEVASRAPGALFVDAPVSGSRAPAESGELVILASGPGRARPVVDPVFAALGRRTLWLGPAGLGSRLKLVLNTWLAFEVEAAAEAMALARYWDVPDEALASAITGSPLVSPYAASKLKKMQSGNDSPDFSLRLALKDLMLVEDAAGPTHSPVAAAIAQRWRNLDAQGAGALDVSAARLGLGPD